MAPDTSGNYQRPVFSLDALHYTFVTIRHNWSTELPKDNERKTNFLHQCAYMGIASLPEVVKQFE